MHSKKSQDTWLSEILAQCVANPIKYKHTHCITIEQVKFPFNKFKTGQPASTDGLLSDNFFNVHMFYTAILHYYLPVC